MTYAELGQLVTTITGVLLLGLTGYGIASLRYRVPGTTSFVALTVAGAVWSFGYTIEMAQTTTDGFMNAARVEYLGLSYIPGLWLFVALHWMELPLARSWRFRALVLGLSTSLLLVVSTNDWHHWWYASVTPTGRTGFAEFKPGPLYSSYLVLFLATFALSTALLWVRRRSIPLFRRKASIIAAANLCPIIFTIAYQSGFRPGGLDLTLFALIPSFSALAWGLFRHELIRIVPVARERIVESMEEAVLVIDEEGRLVDHNAAARPHLDEFHQALLASKAQHGEMTVSENGQTRTYRYRRSTLRGAGRTKGVVVLLSDITEEKRLLEKLAHQASHDALTGLANRRSFEEAALGELTRAQRHGGTLALVLFDLDWFKTINDRFGHPAGDSVLRGVCEQVSAKLRPYDLFARLGGEEFAVLMPGAQAVEAREAAERWRLALETAKHTLPGADFPVTASFGVATLNDLPLETSDARVRLDTLMVLADRALYRAKNEGRNRVV